MGEVYRAHDKRLDRYVAIKVIRTERMETPEARERFQREARIAAGLNHPAIVQIHDILEWDGGDCIVMELVEGRTLATLLEQGWLSLERTIHLALQITEGLAAAHAKGIVHRDLKAENVMVSGGDGPAEQAKILDFGLAKPWLTSSDSSLTEEGQVVGTYHAMSPEQAQGKPIDSRSDLFSLGALLYQVLTRQAPFRRPTAGETLTRICVHQPPPLATVNPQVPTALSDLIERLLQKDPAHRPSNAFEVISALSAIADEAQRGAPYMTRSTTVVSSGQATMGVAATIPDVPAALSSGMALKTLLLSDIVGSTHLVEILGDGGAAALFRLHDRAARDLLAQYDGREIDKTDGFLMLFDRPLNAALYAQAYHQALEQLSQEQGVELAARVGIHIGEVALFENPPEDVARGAKPFEVEGLAKPMAARLMSLALGRQTLVTRGFYDVAKRSAVGSGPEAEQLEWLAHGTYRFKGVEHPIRVFEVGITGRSPLSPPPDSEKVTRVPDASSTDSSASTLEVKAPIESVASRNLSAPGPVDSGESRRKVLASVAVVVVVLLVGLLARQLIRPSSQTASSAAASHSLAVLGFHNLSEDSLPSDPEAARLFSEGLDKLRRLDALGAQELLEAAVAAAPDHPLPHAVLAEAWSLQGYDQKAKTEAKVAADASGRLPDDDRAVIEGRYHQIHNNWAKAIETYGALFRAHPDDVDFGLLLVQAQRLGGQAKDALATLEALRQLKPPAAEDPRIDLAQARVQRALGDYQQVRLLAEQAVRKGKASGSDLLVARARIIEAGAFQELGDHDGAMAAADDARTLFEAAGDRRGVVQALELTAFTVKDRGDLEGAKRLFESSLAVYREIGNQRGLARVQNTIGKILLTQGQMAEAEELFHRSLATFRRIDARFEAGATLLVVGKQFLALGELDAALSKYREAQELFTELNETRAVAVAIFNIAEIHYLRGELEQAQELLDEALAINREIGNRVRAALNTYQLGKVHAAKGELVVARDKYREALAVQQQFGKPIAVAQTRIDLASILLVQGKPTEAEDLARQAEEVLLAEELAEPAALAQSVIARSLFAQGKIVEARAAINRALTVVETSEDRFLGLTAAIVAARLRAVAAPAAEVDAAVSDLTRLASQAETAGLIEIRLEARLAAGEVEAEARRLEAARTRLETLRNEATALGYGQIATRAAASLREI